jgi:hypothetical protein
VRDAFTTFKKFKVHPYKSFKMNFVKMEARILFGMERNILWNIFC